MIADNDNLLNSETIPWPLQLPGSQFLRKAAPGSTGMNAESDILREKLARVLLDPVSDKASYHKISWSLEAARLAV